MKNDSFAAIEKLIETLTEAKEELSKNMNASYGAPGVNMSGESSMAMAEKQEGVGMMRELPKSQGKVHIVHINKEECLEMSSNGQWNLKKKSAKAAMHKEEKEPKHEKFDADKMHAESKKGVKGKYHGINWEPSHHEEPKEAIVMPRRPAGDDQ